VIPLATTEQLQARLTEAENALHEVMMGKSVRTIVDQSGERIEFSPTNTSRLSAYIEGLKRQLGLLSISGPMRVYL